MAFCFGASPSIAAFLMGYRFANLMRRLFGEGTLLAGFSPHFESIRKKSEEKAAGFFRDLYLSLSLFLTVVVGILEMGLYSWWKWGGVSPETKEILILTMVMLPGVIFICLYALFSAFLQCEKKYFLPGVAPIMFNIGILGAIWWVKDWASQEAMMGLSVAVVVAFFLQWIVVVPTSLKFLRPYLSWRKWDRVKLFSPQLRLMIGAITLTVIGVGAVQINAALDTVFARFASLSGPAYLNYAMRLYQLPVALFGISLSSALLPPLSRAIQEGAIASYKELLRSALSRSFSLMMPCTVAILVLGTSLINVIYGHGSFDMEATVSTVPCLWAYSLGLIPAVFVLLLAPAFYAEKDYWTPLYGSVYSVVLNIILNLLFIFAFKWGTTSVALATAISAIFNCSYLAAKVAKKIGPLFDRAAAWSFVKTSTAALFAGGVALALGFFLLEDPSVKILFGAQTVSFARDPLDQFLHFSVLGGFFILTFFSYAWVFNAEEILQLVGFGKKNFQS